MISYSVADFFPRVNNPWFFLQRIRFLHGPIQMLLCGVSLTFMVPAACSIFPQKWWVVWKSCRIYFCSWLLFGGPTIWNPIQNLARPAGAAPGKVHWIPLHPICFQKTLFLYKRVWFQKTFLYKRNFIKVLKNIQLCLKTARFRSFLFHIWSLS